MKTLKVIVGILQVIVVGAIAKFLSTNLRCDYPVNTEKFWKSNFFLDEL